MSSLSGKVVIVTGASSGIGAASALELAKYSPRLVLNGRNEKALNEVKQKCVDAGMKTDHVALVIGDITEEDTIKKIVQTAKDNFGAIDVVFNNAGYGHKEDGPIHMGGTVKALDDMYKIFVRTPYLLVQECLPELVKHKGVVINCSGGLDNAVDPQLTAYSTAKAALDYLTKLMAVALGMKGVRVNGLNPGFIKASIMERMRGNEAGQEVTDVTAKTAPFEQRLATPEEVARVVVFLASDQSAAITAHNLVCDLGSAKTNPVVDLVRFK